MKRQNWVRPAMGVNEDQDKRAKDETSGSNYHSETLAEGKGKEPEKEENQGR